MKEEIGGCNGALLGIVDLSSPQKTVEEREACQ